MGCGTTTGVWNMWEGEQMSIKVKWSGMSWDNEWQIKISNGKKVMVASGVNQRQLGPTVQCNVGVCGV